MADQIQIPQHMIPQGQPPAPPYDLVAQGINRNYAVSQMPAEAINSYADWKIKQQQLKAGAFEAGGPYLMNALYGNGQQASNTPPGQMAGQQTPQMTGQSNMPPPSQTGDSNQNPSPPPGQNSGAVGDMAPTNGMTAPQPTAQTMPSQPQQPQQDNQLSQPIQASVSMGAPDFTGHLNRIKQLQGQMAGVQNMGKYGKDQQAGLATQIGAEKSAMDAEQLPAQYQKTQGELAMQPTEAALKKQELANAGQQIPMEVRKTVAGEVSKQGQDSQQIRDLQTLAGNLQQSLGGNLGLTGNLKGDLYRASGGRAGSASAANMQNSTIPLATGLNTVLSHRFNAGEVQALSQSLIPQPKDTPQYQAQKLQNLNKLLNVMASGNEQNVQNVKDAIIGGTVPKVGIPSSQSSVSTQIPSGRVTVVSPTGQVGHIPQNQLQAALAQGYKQQ